ncbi:hypothetical protein ACFQ3S_15885 [Mucilaginibacter terrae]|uniref:hypothetical protein n=1 Tax=Mucilaginibacter terrae TaxID=1955052 RepID=UPI0036384E05
MNESANFSGQPVISQVLKYMFGSLVKPTAKTPQGNQYYKRFKTYHHFGDNDFYNTERMQFTAVSKQYYAGLKGQDQSFRFNLFPQTQ